MDKKAARSLLINQLCSISEHDKMNGFLACILTGPEIRDIVDRIRIYSMLIDGEVSQRKIATELGVSLYKVTRGAANLSRHKPQKYFKSE